MMIMMAVRLIIDVILLMSRWMVTDTPKVTDTTATVTTRECQFCHSEPLFMFSADQQKQVKEKGGFIVPMPA